MKQSREKETGVLTDSVMGFLLMLLVMDRPNMMINLGCRKIKKNFNPDIVCGLIFLSKCLIP